MRIKHLIIFLLFSFVQVQLVQSQDLKQNINVHDPVMIKQNNRYYLYCTGKGISVWSSKDRINWKAEPPVFPLAPQWAVDAVPGFKGYIWAPDISFSNGLYYLYYAASTFGKNTSAIGVATNVTLNPMDSGYKWVDHGMVIRSEAGKTNWNAIDPNLITDNEGIPYLTFGSFWDGIKIIQLKADRLGVEGFLQNPQTIASRGDKANAIEAPFIFKKKNYYYLFTSIDYCCRGKESTYKMVVGRSKLVTGPYLDDDGKSLATGGGRLVLKGSENWYGVGHNAVATFDKIDFLIFHGYSALQNGAPKLLLRQISWKNGWPVVEEL
ncbi:family 43 glycosylhydrolase [Pedobacter petrophilus]|uniref:Family 43 glycosylhydrolase n=1 Tax=Pedobacter petrophilus TaxID=1908241 RepID=A0A7K0FY06_9SPHI|nr:family 43 glycosylhydrolase [Pedobacter petrophilus]MRX76331.1 family 43 glycosylhydrolase [Pedobacter petrophilus]